MAAEWGFLTPLSIYRRLFFLCVGKSASAKKNVGLKRSRSTTDDGGGGGGGEDVDDADEEAAFDAADDATAARGGSSAAKSRSNRRTNSRFSLRDRRRLCDSISRLSPDDCAKLVAIIAQKMPDLQPDETDESNASNVCCFRVLFFLSKYRWSSPCILI